MVPVLHLFRMANASEYVRRSVVGISQPEMRKALQPPSTAWLPAYLRRSYTVRRQPSGDVPILNPACKEAIHVTGGDAQTPIGPRLDPNLQGHMSHDQNSLQSLVAL